MRSYAWMVVVCLAAGAALAPAEEKPGKWIKMFDGKTLNGWKANENPESWTVVAGALQCKGNRSHLFWMKQECENCEFKAKVRTQPGSNSGMYFRTAWGPGFPKGYEAQVNNTHGDWRKTGSLYGISDVKEQHAKDNEWWEEHIIADGNHIIIKINGKAVVDYIDKENRFTKGYLALQGHDPKSVVEFKDLQMRALPAKK